MIKRIVILLIITIPDKLWDEVKAILPMEKPLKTIGRPMLPYRKARWYSLYFENWMPVEDVTKRIWLWLYLSPVDSRTGINWMFSKRHGSNY